MKYDAEKEQEIFWDCFDEKLAEKGYPFGILHVKAGKVTPWATVNKNKSFVNTCIAIDFSVRSKTLRLNIYIRNNLSLFSVLEENKAEINAMIGVPVEWVQGSKNPNTRRIKYDIPLKIGDKDDYGRAIEKAIPIVERFIVVCRKYAEHEFFDY
ncbi:MAG: DUF4268 domain-containing protein [Clostridia bacterium]|nr:DUF4268 domain-containing protein [Clostridia bacterium]